VRRVLFERPCGDEECAEEEKICGCADEKKICRCANEEDTDG
jgi:hypothetical protein